MLKTHLNNSSSANRNILLPYYPKEYALRELTQLYSFTGLQIIQDNLKIEQNQNTNKTRNQKTTQQKNIAPQPSNTPEIKIPQKERKNTKMTENILPQDLQEKFEQKGIIAT